MRYHRSPEDVARSRSAAAALRRASKLKPFVPTPWSHGPHAQAANDAGGKLLSVPLNRDKFNAELAAHAPGCASPIHVAGTNGGTMKCGAKLNGQQMFCAYCQPGVTAESIVSRMLEYKLNLETPEDRILSAYGTLDPDIVYVQAASMRAGSDHEEIVGRIGEAEAAMCRVCGVIDRAENPDPIFHPEAYV